MKIFNDYPIFNAFILNEQNALAYIHTRGLVSKYPELASAIELAYFDLKNKQKINPNLDFVFHCDFEMIVEGHPHRIIIGANVIHDYSLCSYFLGIVGKEDDKDKLIRKFHFDFALPGGTKQKVPVYHLQYGGKLSPEIESSGLVGDRLDSWLSVPRLTYSPVNIALLLDILFCEFNTVETNELIQSDLWRTLIYNNERFLTANYYKKIFAHIDSASYKKEKLLRDFCYGE